MSEKAPLVAFRPKPRELEQLRAVQERIGGNQSDALRYALKVAADSFEPKEERPEDDWKALYIEEKELSKDLSKRLMELSEKVADSLQAAQVLHGATVAEAKALEDRETKDDRSRWQRLRDAWRG